MNLNRDEDDFEDSLFRGIVILGIFHAVHRYFGPYIKSSVRYLVHQGFAKAMSDYVTALSSSITLYEWGAVWLKLVIARRT